jgi:hypothetical protein
VSADRRAAPARPVVNSATRWTQGSVHPRSSTVGVNVRASTDQAYAVSQSKKSSQRSDPLGPLLPRH